MSEKDPPEFIRKLLDMLNDHSIAHIISWGLDRTSFVIDDPNTFAQIVLPSYFNHNTFASFVRQLNKYDFHKKKVSNPSRYSPSACEWENPFFKADQPDLIYEIKRKKYSLPKGNRLEKDEIGALSQQVQTLEMRNEQLTRMLQMMSNNYDNLKNVVTQLTQTVDNQQKVLSTISVDNRRLLSNTATQPSLSWTTPPRLLLVEDNPLFRKIVTSLIKLLGCSYDIAVDGQVAIEKMNKQQYDLVLMDISMPIMDGLSATKLIRQFDKFTPIISLTSYTDEMDCLSYLAGGMNEVMSKPVDKTRLSEIVRRYCGNLITNSINSCDQPQDWVHSVFDTGDWDGQRIEELPAVEIGRKRLHSEEPDASPPKKKLNLS